MTLSPAFLDELRSRTTLSTLIGKSVKLTKAGAEFKGLCPFHSEKSASFWVNDDKSFYHCFGCSAHGDAIRWMTDQRGLPFMDAVKELVAAAGMEMPPRDARQDERDAERDGLIEVMQRAAGYYGKALETAGREIHQYLMGRDITPEMARTFGIGWARPVAKMEPVAIAAAMRDVAVERLVVAGLVKPATDDRAEYDFFRNRIMFPIHDERGRVVAFGGRVLGDGQPKYLNSPDTPIFDKGRTLYNYHRAAPAARRRKRLVVVEGYMDVIGLASIGIEEVVAPNGTALTEWQIQRLWRLAPYPVLCFDGDKAGRAAAYKAAVRALPLLVPGMSLMFVTPPDGKDPHDIATKDGAEAVEAMLGTARSLVDVLWEHEREAMQGTGPEQVAGFRASLRALVKTIKDADVRRAYGDDIALRLRVDAQGADQTTPRRAAMRPAAAAPRQFTRRPPPQTTQSKAVGRGSLAENMERALIAGLLANPEFVRPNIELVGMARLRMDGMLAIREALMDWAFDGCPEGDIPSFDGLQVQINYAESSPLRFSFSAPATPETQERIYDDLRRALAAHR